MLKKYFQASFVILTLMVSFSVQAGFREALSALDKRDSDLMISEIEKAISLNNYEGLSLLLFNLNSRYYSGTYASDSIKKQARLEMESSKNAEVYYNLSWDGLLSNTQATRLAKILTKINQNNQNNQLLIEHIVRGLNKQISDDPRGRIENAASKGNVYAAEYTAFEYAENQNLKIPINQQLKVVERAANLRAGSYAVQYAAMLMGEEDFVYGSGLKALMKTPEFKINRVQGLRYLETYLMENVDFYDLTILELRPPAIACLVGDAYRDGLYDGHQDLKQATFWYLWAGTSNLIDMPCKSRVSKALKENWYPLLNKSLKEKLQTSAALTEEDFSKLPLPETLVNSKSKKNYPIVALSNWLEIYEDGLVKYGNNFDFILGVSWGTPNKHRVEDKQNENEQFIPYVGNDEWRVNKDAVSRLKEELNKIKVFDMPKVEAKYSSCESYRFVDSIKLNFDNKSKSLLYLACPSYRNYFPKYDNRLAIYAIVEKYIPTYHLRCGTAGLGESHFACIAKMKQEQAISEKLLKEQ